MPEQEDVSCLFITPCTADKSSSRQPAIEQLHKMQANLRLDESGIPAAPPAPPVPVATRPNVAVKKEDAGVQARAEYDYEVYLSLLVFFFCGMLNCAVPIGSRGGNYRGLIG